MFFNSSWDYLQEREPVKELEWNPYWVNRNGATDLIRPGFVLRYLQRTTILLQYD